MILFPKLLNTSDRQDNNNKLSLFMLLVIYYILKFIREESFIIVFYYIFNLSDVGNISYEKEWKNILINKEIGKL